MGYYGYISVTQKKCVLLIISFYLLYRERNIRLRQSAPFSEKVEDSQFEFKKMAETATKSIFIVNIYMIIGV